MAKSNKRKLQIQQQIKRLITHVTEFEEEDENFPICLQFVNSNIKYHRYLTPDSHKIHKTLDGLCEKFQVHSQGQKAKDLQELATAFLDQPGLDGKNTGKTDVHYAMISLLLNLANAPTLSDFVRRKPEVTPEEEDDFDWAAYLLEGQDLNFLSHASSESSEDEPLSESEGEEDAQKHADNGKTADDGTDKPDEGDRLLSGTPRDDTPHKPPTQMLEDDVSELKHTLVVEYWKGKNTEQGACGSHAACNTYNDWKSYQHRLNPFQTFQDEVLLTEPQIIRETLWMLSGVTELFVFQHDGRQFSLNPNVYVLHLTPESLANSLGPLMHRAQQVHALDTFVENIVSNRCNWTSSGPNESPPLQTYIAFADCISEFLNDFRAELLRLEKVVMKQETNVPLTSISLRLKPWLQKVEAVHKIILYGITAASSLPASHPSLVTDDDNTQNVEAGDNSSSNCYKASLLLDTLYSSVFESDLMAELDSAGLVSLLLSMLIKCSRPLLQIISDWINNGVLNDTASEFILQRNKEIKSLDETFWEKAFVPSDLTKSMVTDPLRSKLSDTKLTTHESSSSFSDKHSKSYTTDPGGVGNIASHHSSDYVIEAGPKFLQPILREAILTGKSMEMLENLGRMGEALNIDRDIFKRPPSLYELFVEDLKQTLNSMSGKQAVKDVTSVPPTSDVQSSREAATGFIQQNSKITDTAKDPTIEQQLSLPGLKDTLLEENFAVMFDSPDLTAGGRLTEPVCPVSADCDLQPLMRLCSTSLYPHISQRYRAVCSKLVNILKEEYNLMGCIHAMQRYYLMSSGEVMYDFYMPVFSKIESHEFWRECSVLEMFLHDAVEPVFPEDVARLSVGIANDVKSQQNSAIGATDCIQLKYNVPWPVDVVISGRCQKLYNDVFTFILQIKRAKYAVDQLRFDDLCREQAVPASARELVPDEKECVSRSSCIHQFHLLRFRLLFFVNSVHDYIMTRILHSTELEFGCQLDTALDLDQIIHIHSQYVDAIHERCLLHPRLTMLRGAVIRILNLTLTFGVHWRQGVDFARVEVIQEIDAELTRCIHFLSSFLQIVVKRGSFPHLESLAFALASSLQFQLYSGQKVS